MRFIVNVLILSILFLGKTAFAQLPYSDSFKNSTAGNMQFGGTNFTAFLTGGTIDPEGAGYLRLTDTILVTEGQSAFARNVVKFPSNKGLLVTFEYYTWRGKDGDEGDGISFFLYDAAVENEPANDGVYGPAGFVIGGGGGALGYTNFNGTPGLRKAYLGIGFDEYGNFATKDKAKETGIEIVDPNTGLPLRVRENVTIRGDGSGLGRDNNYKFLLRALTYEGDSPFMVQGRVDGRTKGAGGLTPTDLGYRKAKIELIPNGSGYNINVWITEGRPGGPIEHHVVNNYLYNSLRPIPAELSYGFAASTGGATNFHEIRNIDIVIPPSQAAAPNAVHDVSTTAEDTPVTFSIVSNDTDQNGNTTLDFASVDLDPATAGTQKEFRTDEGVYTVDNLGFVTFTPALNFTGTAPSISYKIKDRGFGTSVLPLESVDAARITVTVTPVNDAPVITAIGVTGPEDTAISFTSTIFTSKFTDVDISDALNKIRVESLPANGTLKLGGSPVTVGLEIPLTQLAGITFEPALDFFGNTSFLWSASDASLYSAPASVNIAITPVNDDPPKAVNDLASTETNTPVTFSVTDNDTDPDGNATIDVGSIDLNQSTAGNQSTFTVAGQGTYVANNNGTVTFTPVTNYESGQFTATPITYTIKDNTARESATATIAVRVAPKTPPVANADEATTLEDTNATINLLGNDTDLNGNNTIEGSTIDLDPITGGRQNTIVIAGQGTYAVNSAGVLTFAPLANYNSGVGTATPISYTVSDRSGLVSNAASITISVTPVPDIPVAIADAATTTEDASITFSVSANDTDADGNNTLDLTSIDFDPGTAVKTSLTIPNEGTYTAGTNGTITFVPVPNYNSGTGTATAISYTIKDNTGLTSNAAAITVTVVAVNDLPSVSNVLKAGTQSQTVTFTSVDFTARFTDPDNSPLNRIRVTSLPINGSLKLYGTSVTIGQEIPAADLEGITFVPVIGWNGTTAFGWNGFDGTAYAAINASVVITLAAVNQPPVLSSGVKTHTGNTPVTFTQIDFTSRFTDPDNNSLAKIQIVALPTSGALQLFGVPIVAGQEISLNDVSGISYVPAPGSGGTFSFTWNGSDGSVYAANSSTIAITVTVPNVPPVVSDIVKSGTGFTPVLFTVSDFMSRFSDGDNNPLVKVKIVSLPANGTLRLSEMDVAAGQEIAVADLSRLSFTPAVNWGGMTTFAWNGSDGTVYAVNNANVDISILLPTDPNAKIGLAKRVLSVTDGINGSYNVKYLFTLVNYGPNVIENLSLKDNLAVAFAGTTFTVKTVTAFGNLKNNAAFNGTSNTELLLPTSKLNGAEEARVELEINVSLLTSSGTFFNFALAEGNSAITGARLQDRSTNGLRPDPLSNGDVSLSETTPVDLAPRATFVPQGFTPNGDGIHDNLVIQNTLNQKISIEVFNRWGNRIFRSVDYKNDWSGTCTEGVFLGQSIPDGTYFYVVTVADKEKYVGSLTVQR